MTVVAVASEVVAHTVAVAVAFHKTLALVPVTVFHSQVLDRMVGSLPVVDHTSEVVVVVVAAFHHTLA